MIIVMIGNLIDGFEFWGPFDTFEHAENYAQSHAKDGDWLVTEVNNPSDFPLSVDSKS
jgi:hypothetical protein